MSKPEWGTKRICPSCGSRYYDLHRDPIVCPKCGTQFDPEALLKTRRRPAAAAPEPVPVPVAVVEAEPEPEAGVEPVEEGAAAEGAEEE